MLPVTLVFRTDVESMTSIDDEELVVKAYHWFEIKSRRGAQAIEALEQTTETSLDDQSCPQDESPVEARSSTKFKQRDWDFVEEDDDIIRGTSILEPVHSRETAVVGVTTDGERVGINVGDRVGVFEVGITVGSNDGFTDGAVEGVIVGAAVGGFVGTIFGIGVGTVDGSRDGDKDGNIVGL